MIRLQRLLMRLLPRAFRYRHGAAMSETFEARLDAARANGRSIGFIWLREILDLAVTVVRLRTAGAGATLGDVRIGFRGLRRHASFSATAIGTLGLAIGAVTTLWSLVYGVLLRPLPYPGADRIVRIWPDYSALRATPNQRFAALRTLTTRNVEFLPLSDYLSFAENGGSLDAVGFYSEYIETVLPAPGAQPLLLNGSLSSPNLFDVLGVPFRVGRGFVAAEGSAGAGAGGAAPVVILSDALWRTRFDGSADVIGRTVYLSGGLGLISEGPLTAHEVVGVAPPELRYLAPEAELWVPMAMTGEYLERRVAVVGRLEEGISIAAAEPSLGALIRSWSPEQLEQLRGVPPADRVTLETLYDSYAGFAGRRLLLPLGAAALVLLLACANVANLLLSRLPARRQELGMRLALGASRGRLLAQLLTESAVLAAVSAVLGLGVAAVGIGVVHALGPELTPHLAQRFQEVTIDRVVLLGCVAVTGACTLFFGALPALLGYRTGAGAMQPSARGPSGRPSRLIPLLLATELALALVLLTSAGLLIHSFSRLMAVDLGFRPERLLTLTVSLPRDGYQGNPGRWAAAVDGIVEGLSGDTRVEQVAVASQAGYRGAGGAGLVDLPVRLEGQSQEDAARGPRILRASNRVTPGYFEMLGLRVIRGRGITPLDVPGMPIVAVVNETWANTVWPNQDPIGRRFHGTQSRLTEVVGVVADARDFRYEVLPAFYSSLQQLVVGPQLPEAGLYFRVVVRVRHDAAEAEAAAREVLDRVVPEAAVGFAEPWDSEVERAALRAPRFQALVFGAFGLIATVIAAAGVFGVLSYMVSQRTHEIGVRMALGGRPAQIAQLVVGQVAGLAATGLVLGWIGSLAAAKLLRTQLFGITPTDGASHLGASAILLTTAVLAALFPLRRATSVDPMTTLKAE